MSRLTRQSVDCRSTGTCVFLGITAYFSNMPRKLYISYVYAGRVVSARRDFAELLVWNYENSICFGNFVSVFEACNSSLLISVEPI